MIEFGGLEGDNHRAYTHLHYSMSDTMGLLKLNAAWAFYTLNAANTKKDDRIIHVNSNE